MSELHLVRHGQASAGGEDYDRLSPLGHEQSRDLGRTWAADGMAFDRVLIGPRRRHHETCAAVAEVYRQRRLSWPEPEVWPELDEHAGPEIFERHRARALQDGTAAAADAALSGYLRAYQDGSLRWVRGELETPPGLESWQDFRARIAAALERITNGGGRGRKIVAFTSGGAVAAAVGECLDLADVKVLELSWRVRNAAVAEILFSPGRGIALHTFNATPHLREPRLLTYI